MTARFVSLYVARRVLAAVPVLVAVTFLVFCMINLLPGTAVDYLLGQNASPRLQQIVSLRLGLNHPFFSRYGIWLWHALRGNFGNSLTNGIPVAQTLGQRLPVTAEIGVLALAEAVVVAVPLAVLVARRPGGALDRIVGFVSLACTSSPVFVTTLGALFLFAVHLHLTKGIGYVPLSHGLWPNIHSLLIPTAVIASGVAGSYTRILQADLIDQLNGEDYVVGARPRGLSSWAILLNHALRNGLFNLITVVALYVGSIIGGAILVEDIWAIPGLGLLLLQSIARRDVVTVQAVVVIFASVTVCANLLADIAYFVLDPRIRLGRPSS